MTVKQKRNFYPVLSIFFLGIILASIYYLLGGFEEVKVYRLEPVNRIVVGKHFKIKPGAPQVEEHFKKCRSLILEGNIRGDLTVINYVSDSLSKGEVEQFIGVTLREDMAEVPYEFEVLELTSEERYAVFLSMHPLVRPTPPMVEEMLTLEARERGRELRPFFYEIHYTDNSLSVEGWAK